MQAGFGLVEHHQRRRARREQGSHQQQVTQGAVRQLRRRQWPQQPFLIELDSKTPTGHRIDLQPRAGEGVTDGAVQDLRVAHFEDGLQGRCEIAAIVVQHRRARAQLRLTHRRIRVGAKVIIKTPTANRLPQPQHFGRGLQAADLIEQAVEHWRVLRQHLPTAFGTGTDHRAIALHQLAGRAVAGAHPNAFVFDLRVEGKR